MRISGYPSNSFLCQLAADGWGTKVGLIEFQKFRRSWEQPTATAIEAQGCWISSGHWGGRKWSVFGVVLECFFLGGWKNESGKEIDGKSILKWFEALKFLSLFPKSLKLVLLESCWLSLIAEVDTTSSHFLPMLGLCVTATQIFCQCFEDSHSPSMEYFRYSNALV